MMNSNKILTVSYGTFSCTLEGFDDSFGTMKAIAEYFRDLASDDRYFGAEPPQPDAEMLARIAQREVSRRVQAREQEGKIVLSALEDQSAAPTAPPRQPEPQPEPVAAPVAEAPVAEPPQPEVGPETGIADTAAVTAAPEEPQIADAMALQEEHQPAPEATVAAAEDAEEEAEDAEEEAEEAETAEAFFADSPEPQGEYEDESPATVAEDMSEPAPAPADSIAAKLQRIRAVVAQQDEDEGYDEEEFAAPAAAPLMADVAEDEGEDLAADEAEEDTADSAVTRARRDIEEALEADEAADAAEAAEEDAEDADDDLADILRRLEQDKDEEETAEAPVEAEEAAPAPAAAEAPRAPRGRVIKVKRAALDAAIARGDLEEEDAPEAPAEVAAARNSTLSAEDEDELARELAALEAELNGDTDEASQDDVAIEEMGEDDEDDAIAAEVEDAPEAAAEPAPQSTKPARAVLPTIDDDSSPDMSRLMAETDSKMGEADSATNRDAFAHLRAAVAAKKADEAMGGRGTTSASTEAYREDLADVVRPRRPEARAARTERPAADARPAPLKLVAEQRIDTDQPRPAGPVRPRRVAAVVEPVPANPDAESFADFAADMGATKLPELLEAAAAYMSFVEGRDQFSRPQLMGKVRQVQREDFTREDGLRSFGQLLRAGKIEKIKGGRFTVSEDIGYRPDHRAAG